MLHGILYLLLHFDTWVGERSWRPQQSRSRLRLFSFSQPEALLLLWGSWCWGKRCASSCMDRRSIHSLYVQLSRVLSASVCIGDYCNSRLEIFLDWFIAILIPLVVYFRRDDPEWPPLASPFCFAHHASKRHKLKEEERSDFFRLPSGNSIGNVEKFNFKAFGIFSSFSLWKGRKLDFPFSSCVVVAWMTREGKRKTRQQL